MCWVVKFYTKSLGLGATRHWALGIGHWALGIGHWALGIRHWALGIRHWSFAISYGMRDTFPFPI